MCKDIIRLYKYIIRPLLFSFDAEKVHHFSTSFLKIVLAVPGFKSLFKAIYRVEHKSLERKLFGLTFPNPVGLAAGFDKNAELIDELACFGFGFIEIGTLTPVGQPGNEKPRLFRLKDDQAIINRMGFNNDGVEIALQKLKKRKSSVLIGGNIGKNKVTPNEEAQNDYVKAFHALFDYVDYFVVNVSSPNTPNLRALQEKEPLTNLLTSLQELNQQKSAPKPILLKIAPDLSRDELNDVVEIVQATKIAGIIATNTTIDRKKLQTKQSLIDKIGNGGLSGKPVLDKSNEIIRYISQKTNGSIPIIGVGGIMCAEDAIKKLEAGASLVQVYTGFVYEGPSLIKKINQSIKEKELNG